MYDVIHPLRFDVIGPIFGCVPFHIEVELKTTFCPVDGVDCNYSAEEKDFSNKSGSRKFFCHGEKAVFTYPSAGIELGSLDYLVDALPLS